MQDINVTITLKTGQRHSAVIQADAPLLQDLHVSLAVQGNDAAQAHAKLLHFPIDEGRAALTFQSSVLESIETSPPVLLNPAQISQQASLANNAQLPGANGAGASYVQIDDFLTPAENRKLIEYTLASEADFEGSKVYLEGKKSEAHETRKSRVNFKIRESEWRDIFLKRLNLHLSHVGASLGLDTSGVNDSEIQLTASNDGDFFLAHADSDKSDPDTKARYVTFVYYFFRSPQAFSGGNLLFYHTHPEDVAAPSENVTSVKPVNNMMVVFASDRWHEVDMVSCPSRELADSRFTINGWLRRTEK
ncbi:MAG: 2OG-Fe(II) oxygenase [Pseudomonadota bacterium]